MGRAWTLGLVLMTAPVVMGADGCESTFSETPAPQMSGTWDVAYNDGLAVEIAIGGAVYTEEVGAMGGVVEITHEGQPLMFDLRCERDDVVCPSEVWPAEVGFRQDDAMFPHRVWLQLPTQECSGELVAAVPAECGAGTSNEACEDVCDGEVVASSREAFGTIDEAGENWSVGLGAGFATNGLNCVLLGTSVATGSLTTTGGADMESWDATETAGDVTTTYSGGCLWAREGEMSDELEALVVAAQVQFVTGFSGTRR